MIITKPQLSLIVPVYNEEASLPELYDWINRVLSKEQISFEIIFVDDGSFDKSWEVIRWLCKKDKKVVGISFNRNFGKSAALQVGFDSAKGNVLITMDADLQDSPEEIPALYGMICDEGYHLVSGWKRKRRDPLEKRLPSRFFNYVTRVVSGIRLHDFNCGLKAYHAKVAKNIQVYGERHRYLPLLVRWAGFDRIGEKVVEHHPRKYGKTKFGMKRYITGFLDLLSISFVTRFGKNPMHLFGLLGTLSFISGFGITVFVIAEKIYKQYHKLPVRDVVDQPLFFLALVALIVGMQLFLAGFLGEMIFLNNPGKNDYSIAEKINHQDA